MKKTITRIMASLLCVGIIFAAISTHIAQAATVKAIKNNGLNGIYVDINSKPYTSTEKQMRTLKTGCTWYVGARVAELTGKNPGIHAGKPWWNNGKGNYGYSAGNEAPTGKAVVCYTNHVSIVEAFDGATYTISEGGNQSGKESEKYCQITTRTLSQIKSLGGSSGTFLGFVYLGVPFPKTDTENPSISNPSVSNITSTGFDVSCIAKDNVGVQRVAFPTWTERNGQDDIIWHEGIHKDGRWSCHINVSQHKGETGTYITHIYAYDAAGNSSLMGIGAYTVGAYANDIKMNKSSIEMETGDSTTLVATVYPADAIDKRVKWSSSDTSIVTVSNGKLNAVGSGTAIIKASLRSIPIDGNSYATCTVKVKDRTAFISSKTNIDSGKKKDDDPKASESESDVSSKDYIAKANVSLSQHDVQLNVGETVTINATVEPSSAIRDSLKWTSSNTAVVEVENGTVRAKGEGTATVKASLGYVPSEGKWYDSCTITVVKNETTIPVNDVKLLNCPSYLTKGNMKYLRAEVYPSNASNKKIKFTSSNEDVALIVDGAWLIAMEEGSTTISVITQDGGYSYSCMLNVGPEYHPATGINIDRISMRMNIGDTQTLRASVVPSNATNMGINWYSSDESVARVDQNGRVTAVKAGNAMITAQTVEESIPISCDVIVLPSAQSSDRNSNDELCEGEYTSSDGNVAYVRYEGSNIIMDSNSGSRTFYPAGGSYFRHFDGNYLYIIDVTSRTTYTYTMLDYNTNATKLTRSYSFNS